MKSDLRATLKQMPRPRLNDLMPLKKPAKGQSMLWWDSFDEGTQLGTGLEGAQAGTGLDPLDIDFRTVDELLAEG